MEFENQVSIPEKIIAVTNSIQDSPSEELRNQLISFLNDLINKDFNALVQLLYRIDVNEKKLKQLLQQNKNTDASLIIADLIIKRQLQKIATRKQFNNTKKSPPDDIW
ncbi:MAG TPA: hypothetical protein VNS50_13075 [Ginsengibacter sp.]|nr:hypothetical protein [Ginsengibacter sp.]